jgi:endonuclease YncB( thermonuclease family)
MPIIQQIRLIRIYRILAGLLLLFGPLVTAGAADGVLPGKVTRVVDGDTIDVLLSSGRIRVRLQGIDAPERDQPGGREAQHWLQRRLIDHAVQLEPISQDRYERMVAIVHTERGVVNEELLQAGHAWAYRHYLRRVDRHYCELEEVARRAGIGLWAAPMPHAPWQHRETNGHGPFMDFSNETAGDCRKAARR